jgi:hypothetical protein
MKSGVILAYSDDVSAGVIKASNGKRFTFSRSQWASTTPPRAGQLVVFKGDAPHELQIFFEPDLQIKKRA